MGDRTHIDEFAKLHSPEAIAAMNERFREQVETLKLVYDCRECVHIDTTDNRCSMAYPNQKLLDAAAKKFALEVTGDLVFCKYFESV